MVTGPESAQKSSVGKRLGGVFTVPASEECQSEEGSNWERTAQEAQEEVPGGQRGEDLGTVGQAQEPMRPRLFLRMERLRAFPKPQKTSGWKPGMESSEDSREEPDLPAESPESSARRPRGHGFSPGGKPRCHFKRKRMEPGAERPENLTAGQARPVAERRLPNHVIRALRRFSRPSSPDALRLWNPGWQAPYHQAPQNYPRRPRPISEAGYLSSWQVPPLISGGTPYQRPTPIRIKLPTVIPARRARDQRQPGYQKAAGRSPAVAQQPASRRDRFCTSAFSASPKGG